MTCTLNTAMLMLSSFRNQQPGLRFLTFSQWALSPITEWTQERLRRASRCGRCRHEHNPAA